MAYTTRVANPPSKKTAKKKTKKKAKDSIAVQIATARAAARKKTKKKTAKKSAPSEDLMLALGPPRAKKRAKKSSASAVRSAGKKAAKKAAKKRTKKSSAATVRSAGSRARKKAAKKRSASRALTEKQLIARLDELKKLCSTMRKQLGKGKTTPAERTRMMDDLKAAIISNAACRLAAKRWGTDPRKCSRKYGPRGARVVGPQTMGKWSPKTHCRHLRVPSLDNKDFWGS